MMLRPIMTDQTCSVTVEQLWELSGLDQTLLVLRSVVIKLTRSVMNGTSLEMTGLGRGASGLSTVLCPVMT